MTTVARLRPNGALVFLAGFLAGTALFLVIRTLANALNPDPCQWRTLSALLPPLLLGPGGLATAALLWNRQIAGQLGWGVFGLGLAVASLFPALFYGAQDVSRLRAAGCAGGFVIFTDATGRGVTDLSLASGSRKTFGLRVGGFPKDQEGRFTLEARLPQPNLHLTFQKTTARLGEVVQATLTADQGLPANEYPVGIIVRRQDGRGTDATLTVNVVSP